MSAGINVA